MLVVTCPGQSRMFSLPLAGCLLLSRLTMLSSLRFPLRFRLHHMAKDFAQYLVQSPADLTYQYSLICSELAGLFQEVNMMMADESLTESRGYLTAMQSADRPTHAACERAGKYEALSISTAILQLRGKINSLTSEKEFIKFCLTLSNPIQLT